jgi:dihydroorotate dehydrogenase (fumarate)
MRGAHVTDAPEQEMSGMKNGIDLATKYLGLDLVCPLVASASPLSLEIDDIEALEQAGAGAVVLYSLFQEQIVPNVPRYGARPWDALGRENFAVDPAEFPRNAERYVDHVAAAKRAVSIPIIASLNVFAPDRWTEHAHLMEQAGADALELDIYSIETNLDVTSEQIERRYVEVVEAARAAVGIPIAVKLTPFCTSFGNLARRLVAAGANGLVLFNRVYQPTIDVDRRVLLMQPTLSTSSDGLVPMTWIALLAGRVQASLAASGGVHNAVDAIRMILAGADVVMMCSALLQSGEEALSEVRRDVVAWMLERDFSSLDQIRAEMSLVRHEQPDDFRRAGYAKVLNRYW